MKPMLMYVAAAGVLLLGAIPIYGRSDGLTNQHEILGVAVAKNREPCNKYEGTKTEPPSSRKLEPLDSIGGDIAHKISLPIVFRVGRFQLSRGDDETTPEGRRAIVIKFSPKQEKMLRLGPEKNEDPVYNDGMNKLAGKVLIDPETGSIMRAEGSLTEGVPFKWKILPGGDVEKLDFEFVQERRREKWVPSTLVVTARATFFKIGIAHRQYNFVFQCSD